MYHIVIYAATCTRLVHKIKDPADGKIIDRESLKLSR
jgi:hypothetical protein